MTLVFGALTIGAILGVLALGVFVSYRVFEFADITMDGSFTLGGALTAVLLVARLNPFAATLAGVAAGAAAGAITGTIHRRLGVNKLLAGILVMTSLYSVNLRILGRSNAPLLTETSLATLAERAGRAVSGGAEWIPVFGWHVTAYDLSALIGALLAVVAVAVGLHAFFGTDLGTAMQAAGDGPLVSRALGVNVDAMVIAGLSIANALGALAGALFTQYQGFADVQMGIGMVVWGLASVVIGQALVGTRRLGYAIAGTVMGSLLFRLIVAGALRAGLDPTDLKILTAAIVIAALVAPRMIARRKPVVLASPPA
jgi:putative ABC transport system permease protein